MNQDNLYALIHSPLVGPMSWKLVANQMEQRDIKVIVPILSDTPDSNRPFWKQHVASVVDALAHVPGSQPVILVGHSGAGLLLPAMRHSLANPVDAYVFVDASVPRDRASRLGLMKSEDPDWAKGFQEELERGSRYPAWDFSDLSEVIPDETVRGQIINEMHPRGLSFFTESIPVFSGWPDAPCVYIRFSAPYKKVAARAREDGWPTYEVEAGHFHMLVDEAAVTDLIVDAVNKLV
jgi:pimeloyl-ACP methyl ester carboxylesterase